MEIRNEKELANAIRFIKIEELIYNKLKLDGLNIAKLKNPTLFQKVTACKQNGLAIQYINDPCLEVQLAALRQSSKSLNFIKNLHPKIEERLNKKNIVDEICDSKEVGIGNYDVRFDRYVAGKLKFTVLNSGFYPHLTLFKNKHFHEDWLDLIGEKFRIKISATEKGFLFLKECVLSQETKHISKK